MNLTSNNIMLLTNSQSPQENKDKYELKQYLKKVFMMMFPYIVKSQSNNQLCNHMLMHQSSNNQLCNQKCNHMLMLFVLNLNNLFLIHYQFQAEWWPQLELCRLQSELCRPQSELCRPQSELQWSQLNQSVTNNLCKCQLFTDNQLLDLVKECKCHSEPVTWMPCQFTELHNNLIIHRP